MNLTNYSLPTLGLTRNQLLHHLVTLALWYILEIRKINILDFIDFGLHSHQRQCLQAYSNTVCSYCLRAGILTTVCDWLISSPLIYGCYNDSRSSDRCISSSLACLQILTRPVSDKLALFIFEQTSSKLPANFQRFPQLTLPRITTVG